MTKQRARELRSKLTGAERVLWRRLRALKSHGFHFRRQAPIRNYVLDFVCHRVKLIVELDGAHHAEEGQIAHDVIRTRFLESEGYRVMRIWNNEVFRNPDGVAEAILALCKNPHPICRSPDNIRGRQLDLPTRGR